MRISRQAKEQTRQRILQAARRQFVERGFEASTTRELASEAGIAAGTLFNYFKSKEDLALALVAEALSGARQDFHSRLRGDEALDEQLFLHVACGLRRLEPLRGFVGAVLETALSPFVRSGVSSLADDLRTAHLELVEELISGRDPAGARPGSVTLYLYWTLYLGVMAFWSGDESHKQEETLAVLDHSLGVFVNSLDQPTTHV